MRNKNNIFWGAILVAFGFYFLGITNDWFEFDFSMREIARFWPVLIILGGVAVLFNERKTIYNPTTALLVAFAIPLGIYHASSNAVDEFKDEMNEELNFDWKDDNDYSSEEDSTSNSRNTTQNFSLNLDKEIEEVALEIGGGAAEFHLEEATGDNLFQAETKLFEGKYSLVEEKKGKLHEIEFTMNNKNNSKGFKFGKGTNNDVYLKLNKKPTWDIDLNIGAGDLHFDLSEYKVKRMDVKTGAANLNLKVGVLVPSSIVNVESGVAKVKISVPKEAACEIELDGALNAKDFEGFTKSSSGKWRNDGFDASKSKINIKIESGLSAVTVDRY
jgi:hypothetical protein